MKTRPVLLLLALIAISAVGVLTQANRLVDAVPLETITPESESFLPLVAKQPTFTPTPSPTSTSTPTCTPTPTPTCTPTPTPTLELEDGEYRANLPNGGLLWFTVTNGGASATDGGFSFQNQTWCPWAEYIFSGSGAISEESFEFTGYEGDWLAASLSCEAISSTQASCTAVRGGIGQGCNEITATATRR